MPTHEASDKLSDLVGYLALRFVQLRPDGDPSAIAESLIAEYAFQRSAVFAELEALNTRYSDDFAASVIDRACLSTDGLLDGKLTSQRFRKELEDLVSYRRRRGADNGSDAIFQHPTAIAIQKRMDTVVAGVGLCEAHARLMRALNRHSAEPMDAPAVEMARPVSANGPRSPWSSLGLAPPPEMQPWREVDLRPIELLLDTCLAAANRVERAPVQDVVWRSAAVNRINRDIELVRRALPLITPLARLGPDPAQVPASPIWQTLLGLPSFEYDHLRVAAIREFQVPKMCVMHVMHLLNSFPHVQEQLLEVTAREAAAKAEAEAAEAAAQAAAERKRQEEERKAAQASSAAAATTSTRRGARM